MYAQELAVAMVAPGKGLLAADESYSTANKRYARRISATAEMRRAYREMLFTTPGIGDFLSGVILFDETIHQSTKDGISFTKVLFDAGIILVIKLDAGAKPLAKAPGETVTEGLDGLRDRIAYNLFTQRPKQELGDFQNWAKMVKPGQGGDFYRMNGAGEMLVFSAADFEDFLEPRPDLAASMEDELYKVVKLLAQNRWPFRLHATYDESISHFLNVFEKVDREIPFDGIHWMFDHAETISDHNLERVKALGGGIAIQHRMAYQGEYFVDHYGKQAAERTPPIKRMLEMDIPVGGGTDTTRVASYNPWVGLYWLVAGKTVGGTQIYDRKNRLDRMTALRLYTVGSSWFSSQEGKKGAIVPGQLADLAVLSDDYFSVPEERIKQLESVLTLVGGKPVYATQNFSHLSPPPLAVMPEWSPVAHRDRQETAAMNLSPSVHLYSLSCCLHNCIQAAFAKGMLKKPSVSLNSFGSLAGAFGSGCDYFAF